MARVEEVRLTLAAIIYSIETDLKYTINQYITPYFQDTSFLPGGEVLAKTLNRFAAENGALDPNHHLSDVVEYLDFGDVLAALSKGKEFLTLGAAEELRKINTEISDIIPIRNRVMHTRPLLAGDFGDVYGFVSGLRPVDGLKWQNVRSTIDKIERNPQYVLTLTLPFLQEDSKVMHSLPYPDFDESGFIGRTKDLDYVKKLILSNSVVSIIGDGGVGKTALALKAAYDIVDMKESCPFDIVVWISAKTTMLTATGVVSLRDTIRDFAGFIDAINAKTTDSKKESLSQTMGEIFEFFDLFPTLLIIDNLETIQTEEIREFIREAQMHCKILITSRVGLGELEYPRKLEGLSPKESIQLIREIARARASRSLERLENEELASIVSKLYFNPLAIKWFVSAVETGLSPNDVLHNKDNLFNFCLSNVLEKLSLEAHHIISTLRASRRPLNIAELVFTTQLAPEKVRHHLNELFKTTLLSRDITRKKGHEDVRYTISEFAKEYLSKSKKLDVDLVRSVTKALNQLESNAESTIQRSEVNEYDIRAILIRTSDEKVVARILHEALELSHNGHYAAAMVKVDEAKAILPYYSEAYRVSAFIKASSDEILDAVEEYDHALELEPDNVKTLYYYAQFALFKLQNRDRSKELADTLLQLRPNDVYPHLLMCRCLGRFNQYDKALDELDSEPCKKAEGKMERIVITERMSIMFDMFRNRIIIGEDYETAIKIFKDNYELFNYLIDKANYDWKVVKTFTEALSAYLSLLPYTHVEDQHLWLEEMLQKHQARLTTAPAFYRVRDLLENKHGWKIYLDDKPDSETALSEPDDKTGVIIRKQWVEDKGFVFIEADEGKFFAHKNVFLNLRNQEDWVLLQDGQKVRFRIGKNNEGPCAVSVRIIR